MYLHFFRYALALLALTAFSALAQAQGFVAEQAWVEDPTGTMTLADVEKAPATSYTDKYFSRGFSKSVFWIRLHIDPEVGSKQKAGNNLIIRIRPPIQDQVQLFDPLEPDAVPRLTGDFYDWKDDEYQSQNLNFVIPVGHAPRNVWLRLRTNQSTLTVIEVMSEDALRTADRAQELGIMAYLVVLFVCLGWGVLSYFTHKDYLVGMYIGRELLAIFYALVMLGYFRTLASGWLPAAWVDPISNAIIFVFVTYVIWFDSQLIRQFKPNRWLYLATLSLTLGLPIEVILQLAGQQHLALILNAYIVLIAIFLVFLTALSTRAWHETRDAPAEQKPVLSKLLLVGVYAVILLAILANRLPAMGFIGMREGYLYLNLFYALVSSVLMMVLVLLRAHRLSRRQKDAHRQLEIIQIEAEQERLQRIEQSNFLKMLAHEIKTPLSVVRMAVGNEQLTEKLRDQVGYAVTNINNVIERLLQVERLSDRQVALQTSRFNLFETIVDTLGRNATSDRWIIDCDPELKIESDQRFVQIILSNLIDNAIKYGADDKPLRISANDHSGQTRVTVTNAMGHAGLPDPQKVFRKYYRAPLAHEHTGSGLGLYLSQELARLLSGQLSLRLEDGGVVFELQLPSAVHERMG